MMESQEKLPTGESDLNDLLKTASYAIEKATKKILELQKELTIANKMLAHSLANNLCPNHRDKQRGKPCLACTIERLERQLHGDFK